MGRRIDAVLFDFGGVFTPSPFRIMDEIAENFEATAPQLIELVFGPYDRDTDHAWHRLERGEIGVGEARDSIIADSLDQGLEGFDPIDVLMRMKIDEGPSGIMVECVRGLRREGYQTAIVTNNVREFKSAWRSMIPVDELFDLVVDSSEVGVRKPDPAIFHLTLERLGTIDPERSVFLDDFHGNITAARGLGIASVLVEDPSQAIRELESILETPA